ncbi:polysaccharide biosynthesis/export family protein [Desulfonatronovibrio hydrogenovorans]|uniref:polysaccharide biosynthesis/export family protein n=1 Tax=Desulfonatronovibrio hydrogenovorans TaxID=53245 RepID=UPI00048F348A|nr:polysaccharide biosynthesis/export family protein [Desulfonatronovibrio hydrogenovorans]
MKARLREVSGILFILFISAILAGPVHSGQENEYYIIGKGDVLDIIVWKEPELSSQVKVRVDGRISMPLVDDILAAGMTPVELKQELTGHLSEFIEGPEVTVIVQNQISKSYYVLGEVAQQGEFPIEKDITLLQALAKSQGLTEWASKRNIFILRQTDDGEERISIDYREIIRGNDPAQNIRIMPGDTLVVPY